VKKKKECIIVQISTLLVEMTSLMKSKSEVGHRIVASDLAILLVFKVNLKTRKLIGEDNKFYMEVLNHLSTA
jgi:hypothetical protein